MKLTVELVDGTKWFYEGEYDELVHLSEKLVYRFGELIKRKDDPSFPGPTTPGPTLQQLEAPASGVPTMNRRWTEQSARRLWGLLYGEQAKLVKFLVSREGGKASYAELCKHMGYEGQHLSGILSAITRNAKTATKNSGARLVDWRLIKNGVSEYFIDPEALSFFETILNQSVA